MVTFSRYAGLPRAPKGEESQPALLHTYLGDPGAIAVERSHPLGKRRVDLVGGEVDPLVDEGLSRRRECTREPRLTLGQKLIIRESNERKRQQNRMSDDLARETLTVGHKSYRLVCRRAEKTLVS